MEETPLSEARKWLAENPSESRRVASRIFKVPESTLRGSIKLRTQNPLLNRGGHNKALSTAQTEALKKWILEQYYLGLGATRQMMWGSFNHKHWHREAVLTAIRDIDLTYDLRSFMRDLMWIQKQTFKESTIISAFRKAGIWPVSCNTALTKLRTYSRPTIQPVSTLPTQVTPKPSTFRGVEEGLQYWKTRVPEGFSSPSKESYRNFLTGTEEVVIGGQLQELDLRTLRRQVDESRKWSSQSRARLQLGGELRAADAHELRAHKAELKAQKLIAREAREARQAATQAQKQLRRAGIVACKEERLRKKAVAQYCKEGLPIPPELEEPIPDPEAIESESESGSGSGSGSEHENDEVIISYED
ncbi:hypothetical protein V491_03319 [Pseudogymnoascus sp. VKM F-3775]|nr:hypothetical protein V491_03319 [Pseudogymnoascus sp. VKM F-3775]